MNNGGHDKLDGGHGMDHGIQGINDGWHDMDRALMMVGMSWMMVVKA